MKTEREKIKYLSECQILEYEIIGNYYIGYHQMIFGTRVRAGKLFEFSCDVDLCCGKGDYTKEIVKSIYTRKMKLNFTRNTQIFEGLRAYSAIKPIYNDVEFMSWLSELADELKRK